MNLLNCLQIWVKLLFWDWSAHLVLDLPMDKKEEMEPQY